jgi:ornithine cyclodeaminase
VIRSEALAAVLTPRLAVDSVRRWLLAGEPVAAPRSVMTTGAGDLLLMPAESSDYVGVKLATVAPGNTARSLPRIQAVYQLFDAATLSPLACFDATAITALRTAAVTAVAVDALSPPGQTRLVVFGTSIQAESHVACLAEVRPLESVVVAGRDPVRSAALARRLVAAGHDACWASTADAPRSGSSVDGDEDRGRFVPLPEALIAADVITTCTSAAEPLFEADLAGPRAVVAAIGSHSPDARELEGAVLAGARIVVEDRDAAWREYGDLILARAEGAISESDIAGDLAHCVRERWGPAPRRTVFKSAGMAWEDLAVARAVYEAVPFAH